MQMPPLHDPAGRWSVMQMLRLHDRLLLARASKRAGAASPTVAHFLQTAARLGSARPLSSRVAAAGLDSRPLLSSPTGLVQLCLKSVLAPPKLCKAGSEVEPSPEAELTAGPCHAPLALCRSAGMAGTQKKKSDV